MTRIIAVSNRKGGTGKTTVTVNLAAELAATGERVLVIDSDTQGHCRLALGVSKPTDSNHTSHAIMAGSSANLLPLATAFENVSLLPADEDFTGQWQAHKTTALRDYLKQLLNQQCFDCIVIDTPPTIDVSLLNVLTAANELLIPVIPHPLAVRGTEQLARLFYQIASKNNPSLVLKGLVPVMAELSETRHRDVIAQLKRRFGDERILRPVRNDKSICDAFAEGTTVRAYAPRSRGAMDFHLLKEEINTSYVIPRRMC